MDTPQNSIDLGTAILMMSIYTAGYVTALVAERLDRWEKARYAQRQRALGLAVESDHPSVRAHRTYTRSHYYRA